MYDHASTSQRGDCLVAPEDQGADHQVEEQDGWQATSSDKEDYLRLTQSYVDGCSTSLTSPRREEDEFVKKEDDFGQKEDDRVESDSSEDDGNRYMTIEELLRRS